MNFDIKDYKDTFQWDMPGDYVPDISLPKEVLEDVQNRVLYALEWKAYPRIKGTITAGKLKWRGIKRKCALIYKEHCLEIYINDNGSITTKHIGTAIKEEGKNLNLIYPIIIQRKNLIDLNFDFAELQAYNFWLQKRFVITFGYNRKLSKGILDQIVKIEQLCKK